MCVQTNETRSRVTQVELVDNWHARWGEVLDAIEHVGQRDALNIDSDGWLSARQNLLVAFVDDAIAGHLCFRVEPSSAHGDAGDEVVVVARVESKSVQPGFDEREVESILYCAAEKRACALRCTRLVR